MSRHEGDEHIIYARAAIRRGATLAGVAGLYGISVTELEAMLREEDGREVRRPDCE